MLFRGSIGGPKLVYGHRRKCRCMYQGISPPQSFAVMGAWNHIEGTATGVSGGLPELTTTSRPIKSSWKRSIHSRVFVSFGFVLATNRCCVGYTIRVEAVELGVREGESSFNDTFVMFGLGSGLGSGRGLGAMLEQMFKVRIEAVTLGVSVNG